MKRKNKNKRKLLDLSVIQAASNGDVEALGVVVKHYEGYIR